MLNNCTWLSRPRRSTIKKKRTDQNWGPGNRERALGYAIKASPGPEMKRKCFHYCCITLKHLNKLIYFIHKLHLLINYVVFKVTFRHT